MKYEQATFRIIVDSVVEVEVSIKGCYNDRAFVYSDQLEGAGKTMERIARAIRAIQRQIENEHKQRETPPRAPSMEGVA